MSELLPVEGETTTDAQTANVEVQLVDPELEAARVAQMEAAEKLAAEVAPTIEAGKSAETELPTLLADAPTEDDLNPLSYIRRETNLLDSTEGN
jgi:hypothetical protein